MWDPKSTAAPTHMSYCGHLENLRESIFVPKCSRERQFSARVLSGSFSLRILRTIFDWDFSSLHLIRCYLDAVGT